MAASFITAPASTRFGHDEDVARFLRTAPPYLRLAMLLAINTGQRQGDLLRLPWSAYDGVTIKLRQRKTGAYVSVPVADELKAALDAAPKTKPDHADQQRRQTVERKRIPRRMGQGNNAGRNTRTDVP